MHSRDILLPGDVSVRFKTTSPVFGDERNRLLAAAYLPGVQFLDEPLRRVSLTLSFVESAEKRLAVRGRSIQLADRWSGDGSLLDLLHLTYSAARRCWLRQGLYSVHSACVVRDNGGVLLVGHSGAGKTTVAMELLQQGGKLLSGNKTLVTVDGSVVKAVAGTRTMTTRKSVSAVGSPGGSEYSGRQAFALEDNVYSGAAAVDISLIALVALNDGVADLAKIEPVSALHRLFPFFLDTVYADTVLLAGGDVFVSKPPQGCQKTLSVKLSQALAKVPVYSVIGSRDFISHSLERQ